MIRISVSVPWSSVKSFLNVKKWYAMSFVIYVFFYWTLWRKTLRLIFLVNDYRPALKESMIPCKCSLVFFLLGDSATSEFCDHFSEHFVCSIFIRPMKMEHKECSETSAHNSDAGESPERKNATTQHSECSGLICDYFILCAPEDMFKIWWPQKQANGPK